MNDRGNQGQASGSVFDGPPVNYVALQMGLQRERREREAVNYDDDAGRAELDEALA